MSILVSCSRDTSSYDMTEAMLTLNTGTMSVTRTTDPDEERITDLNIFIFDENGSLERHVFLGRNSLPSTKNGIEYRFTWLRGKKCQVYACSNFGFDIVGISSTEDLKEYRYHLSYPDEYSRGVPMCGKSDITVIDNNNSVINVKMERLMAKISLSIDRRKLNKNISFNVRSVRIGGCPKSAALFSPSAAEGSNDVFSNGYMKSYSDADDLNIDEKTGISREVNVYMLENRQGNLLPDAKTEKDKILDSSDALSEVCSYIELKAEYKSDSLFTGPEEYLIYRFYLGDAPSNFDVVRNCHYHITVVPSGSGIEEDSWRIDKSNLYRYGKTAITVHPAKYLEGKVGEDLHIWAEVNPEGARMEFGKEELEYDKSRGIYDYSMDKDNHGVTLHLKSPLRPEIIATKADYAANFCDSFSLSAYLVEPDKEPVTDYLWNMKMTLTGNKWVGEYPVFWMDGQEIEFYAVSPYFREQDSSRGIRPGTPGTSPLLYYDTPESTVFQTDILAGIDRRSSGVVQLEFNHITSCVRFAVGSNFEEGAKVKSITISGIAGSGTYQLDKGTWETGDRKYSVYDNDIGFTMKNGMGRGTIISERYFYLPSQNFTQDGDAVIHVSIDDDEFITDGEIPLNGTTWEPGKIYTFYLNYYGGRFSATDTETLFNAGHYEIDDSDEIEGEI